MLILSRLAKKPLRSYIMSGNVDSDNVEGSEMILDHKLWVRTQSGSLACERQVVCYKNTSTITHYFFVIWVPGGRLIYNLGLGLKKIKSQF